MGIINTINPTVKSIIEELKKAPGLLFEELLSTEMIDRMLDNEDYRTRFFSPSIVISCLLSQSVDADKTLGAVIARYIAANVAANEPVPSANTSAFSQARIKLPVESLKMIFEEIRGSILNSILPKWKWRDRLIKLIDGSTVSMPDTEENQKKYPQSPSQKDGLGFPIARLVVAICYISGAALNMEMGPYAGKGTGEYALLRKMLDSFNSSDIVLADSLYASYFLTCELIERGIDFVFPQHHARKTDFSNGEKLGKNDHVAVWKRPTRPEWMDKETYESYPKTIKIREVEVVNDKKQKRVLITSFLTVQEASKSELANLYGFRWSVEIDLRSIKSTMKMDILRAKSPEMVKKEIWSHLLAYNLVRKVMIEAAVKSNKHPRRLSFKVALTFINAFSQEGLLNPNNKRAYNILLDSITHREIGNRAGRQEPRAVKRRPKPTKILTIPRSFYKALQAGLAV